MPCLADGPPDPSAELGSGLSDVLPQARGLIKQARDASAWAAPALALGEQLAVRLAGLTADASDIACMSKLGQQLEQQLLDTLQLAQKAVVLEIKHAQASSHVGVGSCIFVSQAP